MGAERKKDKRQRAHNRAHPEALHREIVDVGAALDRRPEKALETALAARARIRKAERLHGAGLDRKPDALSIEKRGYFESRLSTDLNIWSKDCAFPSLATAARTFS